MESAMNLKTAREKLFPYNETTLRKLVISATVMYFWILIWALVLKLGDEGILIRNYTNLKELTLWERILWDLIPFNYRPTEGGLVNLLLDTLLNCFVFAPIGVAFGYLFKKTNILRDVAICLGIALLIELAQLATMLGNPATEDLITNVAGYFVGFAIYHLVFKHLPVKHGVRFFAVVNAVFAAVTVFSLIATADSAMVIYRIVTKTL